MSDNPNVSLVAEHSAVEDGNALLAPLDLEPTDLLRVELDPKNADEFVLAVLDQRGPHEVPSHGARVKFLERFPEKRKPGGLAPRLVVPATDVSATIIRATWPAAQVEFSEDAGLTYRYLVGTVMQQDQTMARSARYHEWSRLRDKARAAGLPPPEADFADDFPMANDRWPMVHQRVGMRNCCNTDGYALFMEQGTGKTPVTIGRVDWESTRPGRPTTPSGAPQLYKVLVVAPKNVRQNWLCEFESFSAAPGRAIVLRGQTLDRRLQLVQGLVPQSPEQRYVAFVCSYEVMSLSYDIIGAIPWDLVVLDESHAIKSPSAKRTKTAMKLRDVAAARMCLTGTPVCNTPADLFTQLEFLRKGGSGFKSRDAFCDFYGVIKVADPRRGQKRFADVQHMPFMQERLARMAYVVRKAEALPDLPSKVYDVREVEMTAEQAQIYEKVRDDLYYEIEAELEGADPRGITALNVLTRLLRLGQITSGFLTLDPIVDLDSGATIAPKVVKAIQPNTKVESLVALFRGGGEDDEEPMPADEKVIVWCCWVPDIMAVEERLKAEGVDGVTYFGQTSDRDRQEAERRFNDDPSCRWLCGNPGAGGTGLNLVGYDWWNNPSPSRTTDCTTVVYFSQDWSNPKRQQSEDRAHRKGTRRPVRYVDLVVPGTIDEEIRARVLDKKRTATEIQDVRAILARVLGSKR